MIMNEAKIKELLQQTKGFKNLADEHEDESILDINHAIWDNILNELGVEDDLDVREDYYEVFADYEFGQIDDDTVINRIKLMK